MENIYKSGKYLEVTKSWHAEDAPWKAAQIKAILDKNGLRPSSIAEIGCGSGAILNELSKFEAFDRARFSGFDISPQAIAMARSIGNDRIKFVQEDMLSEQNTEKFDTLLVIDVLEHVPDYMGFADKCRKKATYKIYHIPLDIHVSSVMRNAFLAGRYTIGHIHYFTAESALDTLKDTGHEIVDCVYTNIAFGLFKQHPSLNKAIANVPRWLLSKVSEPLAARMFGGYSLLVLAK
jgi:SAM-dependent methyltransferase